MTFSAYFFMFVWKNNLNSVSFLIHSLQLKSPPSHLSIFYPSFKAQPASCFLPVFKFLHSNLMLQPYPSGCRALQPPQAILCLVCLYIPWMCQRPCGKDPGLRLPCPPPSPLLFPFCAALHHHLHHATIAMYWERLWVSVCVCVYTCQLS